MLAHNAKVYIAARSAEKAAQAIADLKTETNREAIFLKLDLGDLKSVKEAAQEFNRFVIPLSCLGAATDCHYAIAARSRSFTSCSTMREHTTSLYLRRC